MGSRRRVALTVLACLAVPALVALVLFFDGSREALREGPRAQLPAAPEAGTPWPETPGERDPEAGSPEVPDGGLPFATRIALALDPSPAGDDDPAAPRDVEYSGRVVDEGRHPVEGALVRLTLPRCEAMEARSDGEGRYRFTLRSQQVVGVFGGSLYAVDGRGRSAARSCHVFSPDRYAAQLRSSAAPDPGAVRDLGDLVLGPSGSLAVQVVGDPAGREGAAVLVESGLNRARILSAQADVGGAVQLDAIPVGPVEVIAVAGDQRGRARARIEADSTASVTLTLEPERRVEVTVVVRATRDPVAGVDLELWEGLRDPGSQRPLDAVEPTWPWRSLDAPVPRTDALGRVSIEGLDRHQRLLVSVPATDRHRQGSAAVESDAETVLVQLESVTGRVVTFPIAAGELPIPPDGTALRLLPDPAPFADRSLHLCTPQIEGGQLVLRGAPRRHQRGLAIAEDGSAAVFTIPAQGAAGAEIAFRPPRTVEVVVRDEKGQPCAEARIGAREGFALRAGFLAVDAEGAGQLTGLVGGVVQILVSVPPQQGAEVAAHVDLQRGGASIEHVVRRDRHLRLQILLDGQPGLPSRYRIEGARVMREDPEAAALELLLPPPPGISAAPVWLDAWGFVRQRVPDASGEVVTLDLVPAARIVVSVSASPDLPVQLDLQRWREAAPGWVLAKGQAPSATPPRDSAGRYLYEPVEAGRYRLRERRSGTCSEPFEVAVGEQREVHFDVRAVGWVEGRLVIPPGFALAESRILVQGPGVDLPTRTERRRQRRGHPVNKGGGFRIPVTGATAFVLLPTHPQLAADPEQGRPAVAGEREVILRLVERSTTTLRVPQVNGWIQNWGPGLKVLLDPDGPGSIPPRVLQPPVARGVARIGGFPAGTYDLWLDPGMSFAPRLLRGVSLPAKRPLDVRFEPGSALEIEIRVAPDWAPPGLTVVARSLGVPSTVRTLRSQGRSTFRLPGLGAGRHLIRATTAGGALVYEQEVSVDGTRPHPTAIPIPPSR